ncbi:unnamed protein product [Adineta steineri]|uniref:Protein-tyrosine-phosphatase n=2 Tax=Adineta steineri TaxID=433720 RepID=A0A814GM68_9BILA|nr:unnamed protein product [Adineta steineri]CAF3853940.1 unnamed protein product [Adineta steineri]
MNVVYLFIFFLLKLSFTSSIIIHEINEAVFLDPKTNTASIRCPLNIIHGSDIQWYNVTNQRYELTRGRYYRINGLQPYDREMICSSALQTGLVDHEEYKFKIRTFDRPLPIRHVVVSEITSSRLTFQWKDDSYNRNANITHYQLVLKYNNTIQYRNLVNHTLSIYTFSSLHPNTLYSIEISAVDIWQRYGKTVIITSKTLPLNTNEKSTSHKIIDRHLLDQSISCYRLNQQLLLIEFNRSKFLILNHIYNLTIYDNQDNIITTDSLYSLRQYLPLIKTLNSFIYQIKAKILKFKIKLMISTAQSEYLGSISKQCEDFYPIYSPLTCTIKSINLNKYHLIIHTQLFNNNKHLVTLKPNYVFYQINENHMIKKNIYDIHKHITADIIDINGNYSVIVENNLVDSTTNDKLNISIPCSITEIVSVNRNNRILCGIIIALILLIICLATSAFVIAYQKGLMPECHRLVQYYTYSFRKNHRSRSGLVQRNDSLFNNTYEEFDSISIPIDQFALHVSNLHKNNDFGFIQLFEDICESSKTYRFSADTSQIEFNKSKNRYINILTYDHSRVKLLSDEKDGRGNYINANYIDGYEKTNAYIATQGPMTNTINDFWRMIWEKDVYVLVMITNIKESGRIKCDVYWPEEGTEMYGIIEVTLISVISLAYYVKRIFSIRCKMNGKFTDHEREVYQFHYTDWPDHGVPLFTLPVLSFIRRSSSYNPESGGPIVVHCSAGVGRTGTYIVIDTMLKKINEQESINIPSFLKHIRQQRNFLVQTEEQFIFIYDVLLEAVHLANIDCNDLELNEQNFQSIIQMLNYYDKTLNLTRIEKQFQLIIEKSNNNNQLIIGQMKENLAKNRTQAILPLDSCRVLLSTDKKPKDGGYINASYIHGYHRVDEFIITQHPMTNTRNDFWQMIWNVNATIIVSLYGDEVSQPDVFDFWPLPNQIIDCGNFHVYLIDEQFECEYIYRDFILKSTLKDNNEIRVKQISNSYWPDACSPMKTSFNLINSIMNFNSKRPIVVHDLFGGYRAATFCALYTMKEQIENENTLNVYELAKLYHTKRPGFWRHNGDLLFLYRCAEILFSEYKSSNSNRHYLSSIIT